MFLFLLIVNETQAQKYIKGIVSDETNIPVKGVIVSVNQNTSGIRTNIHGFYRIWVSSISDTLHYSFPGLIEQSYQTANNDTINITLRTKNITKKKAPQRSSFVHSGIMSISSNGRTRKSMPLKMAESFSPPLHTYNNNTESYAINNEGGFNQVSYNPLSTFSADVHKASYSNIRRFINNGGLPPKDAVRIEEMINYFNYDLSYPKPNTPLNIETEYTTCPWNPSHGLVMVAIQAQKIEKENIPPSNLVFLVDISGSMQASNKLPLVKSSMKMLVKETRPQDKIAIVTYAGSANVALESTPGNNKTKLYEAIDNLKTGGGTAGGDGIELAYKIASQNFITEGNNRIILATDGDFNIGQSSDAEMEKLIEKQKGNGVFITVLGFGMGNYKDSKLETIAHKGNGNYGYIDNSQEAHRHFVEEFGGTIFTVAKDVKFQIEFNPQHTSSYRLIGYENRRLNEEDFQNDKKDAGEIGSDHQVIALYEIIPSTHENNPSKLKYQNNSNKNNSSLKNELLTVNLRYKLNKSDTSIKNTFTQKANRSDFSKASSNIKFAASVAQFGMLLKASDYKGNATIENTLNIAKMAINNNDVDGYKGEYIRLLKTAESIGLVAQLKE